MCQEKGVLVTLYQVALILYLNLNLVLCERQVRLAELVT